MCDTLYTHWELPNKIVGFLIVILFLLTGLYMRLHDPAVATLPDGC